MPLPDSTLSEVDAARVTLALRTAILADSASPLLEAQTFCLALRDRSGKAFLDYGHLGLWTLHRPVVPMHACPRTYASMIARIDRNGRLADPPPKGHIDPHRITVDPPRPDSTGWTVDLVVGHEMASWDITCRGDVQGGISCVRGAFRISAGRQNGGPSESEARSTARP
jgi:hypothetical protein